MVTLWCLQFSLKPPELCYWHHRLPIQGNAVKFISVLSTPNKSSKQGTIWQIRPWKCGFSMWGVKSLKSWMITTCAFSPEYLRVILHAIFLFTLSPLCLSSSSPPPSSLPPSLLYRLRAAPFSGPSFSSFVFLGGGYCDFNFKISVQRCFYNAWLVGWRGAGGAETDGRDDVCGGRVPALLQPIVINHGH